MMDADETFIEEYKSLVHSIAAKLKARVGSSRDLDDLVADGYQGLLEAKRRFDSDKGARFSTFAYYRIRGAMLDGLKRNASAQALIQRKVRQTLVADAVAEQHGELHPRDAASASQDPLATMQDLSSVLEQVATALLVSECHGYDQEHPNPEDQLGQQQRSAALNVLCTQLPEKERKLIELMYFQNMGLVQAGEQIGVSKSWASRIHATALKRLRELMEGEEK